MNLIELHSIGSATEIAVHTAEALCRLEYASIEGIRIVDVN